MSKQNKYANGKLRENWKREVVEYCAKNGENKKPLPFTQLCFRMNEAGITITPKSLYDAFRETDPTSLNSELMDRVGEYISNN